MSTSSLSYKKTWIRSGKSRRNSQAWNRHNRTQRTKEGRQVESRQVERSRTELSESRFCYFLELGADNYHTKAAGKGRTVQYLSLIHISEPTRLRRISYAVFCLKKKKQNIQQKKFK